jgi:hypothetical protein
MNGDGLGGLVVAIIFAGMGMLVLPAVSLAWLIQKVPAIKASRYRNLAGVAGGALGAVIGAAWVTATFYETTWAPPPKVVLNLPANFKHASVIFLEKPNLSLQLQWTGYQLPYMSKQTVVDVPPSGVVNVRSLQGLASESFNASTQDGRSVNGWGSGPGPSEIGAHRYIHMHLQSAGMHDAQTDPSEPVFADSKAFAAYIQKRENAVNTTP